MPDVDFEAQWAVIEAFIEAEAIDPDPDVVDTIREMVRYGEVPIVSGPEMGIPAVSGPEMGIPAISGPEMGIPAVSGPEMGIPALSGGVIHFNTATSAQAALASMEQLAELMLLEPLPKPTDRG